MIADSIAVIAAHADDEVLGCGGTIAKYVKAGCEVNVLILADGVSSRINSDESLTETKFLKRNDAAKRAANVLGIKSIEVLDFPDNKMDTVALLDIIREVERFIETHKPKTVFTHHSGDLNIDHRIVHDAVVTACRPQPGFLVKVLLFFEVPSSTEWRPSCNYNVFHPNVFVDIPFFLEDKLKALEEYEDELRDFPHPRSKKAVEYLARWRGASVGLKAAEAFMLGRKID